MKWSGAGLGGIGQVLHAREHAMLDAGEDAVRETVHEAEMEQRAIIETAVTKTGRRRAETQGRSSEYGSTSPGRIDSGLMVNTTNTRVTREGNTIIGRWGWFDPEDYFTFQDWGTAEIEAAHSLFLSWVGARGRLARRLRAITNGR